MLKNIFRLGILLMVGTAVLVLATPILTINNLLYPIRIDSAYVNIQQSSYNKLPQKGKVDSGEVFLVSPAQLNIDYSELQFILPNEIMVKGWLVADTQKTPSPLLLILPDINEGAINYFAALKEFGERGINVCVIDMPGQGASGGDYYDMTKNAATNLILIVTELKKYQFVEKVAVFGNRTGAAIAIKAFTDSIAFADLLIIQNPPKNFKYFFRQQAVNEWGEFILPVMPALERSYEQRTLISIDDFDYTDMVSRLFVPHMVVVANFFSRKIIDETLFVYHASNYYRKRLYIDHASYQKQTGFNNSKQYYDKISAFINSSLPSKSKKSKFRKLAVN